MIRRIIAVLAAAAALAAVGTVPTAAHGGTAPGTYAICCFEDDGLRSYYYADNGAEVSANDPNRAVKISVTVRAFTSTPGGLPEQVDGAFCIHDLQDPNVGNVQVTFGNLWAGAGSHRAGPTGTVNSNGGPSACTSTSEICVSPFGSGYYWSSAEFSWRRLAPNTNFIRNKNSNQSTRRYATVPC